MIYEKRLGSLQAVEEELKRLDGDAGMRVSGSFGGARCFAFVTRFEGVYTVLVYSARGSAPGKRLQSKEFRETALLMKFLEALSTKGRLDAHVY